MFLGIWKALIISTKEAAKTQLQITDAKSFNCIVSIRNFHSHQLQTKNATISLKFSPRAWLHVDPVRNGICLVTTSILWLAQRRNLGMLKSDHV